MAALGSKGDNNSVDWDWGCPLHPARSLIRKVLRVRSTFRGHAVLHFRFGRPTWCIDHSDAQRLVRIPCHLCRLRR